MIIDLFAGAGGWAEGLRLLGLHDEALGIDIDPWACRSHRAAGHATILADLASWPLWPLQGRLDGLIASPPCTAFSQAGSRAGVGFIDALIAAAHDGDWTARPDPDPLVWLALEPGRWAAELRPRWIALEQVPPVMPLWRAYQHALGELGYATWAGVLNAADYGVPQTRHRAILVARSDRAHVGPPEPTHSDQRKAGDLFGKPRWVSMAQALGWVGEEHPARTVAGHRAPRWAYDDPDGTHGRTVGFPRKDDRGDSPDGFRERDWRGEDDPAFAVTEKARSWVVRTGANTMKHSRDPDEVEPYERSVDEPAPTVDRKVGAGWKVLDPDDVELRMTTMEHSARRKGTEPAPTIAFGHDAASAVFVNTGRDWKPGGDRDEAQRVPLTDPAPAIDATGRWFLEGMPEWTEDRPATTVAGDPRIQPPGHKMNADDPPGRYDGRAGERAIRVTVQDALVLQSFERDYPLQGNRTQQFTQVGNAVPPLLAAHVLSVLADRAVP